MQESLQQNHDLNFLLKFIQAKHTIPICNLSLMFCIEQVRLTSPTCNGVPSSNLSQTLCGPWPGLPPFSDQVQCVCAQQQSVVTVQNTQICYWTSKATYISRWLGVVLGKSRVTLAATAADCAAYTLSQLAAPASLAETAFIYHPSNLTCAPRIINPANAGTDLCTSASALCRLAAMSNGAADAEVVAESGAQMYWLAGRTGAPTCAVKTELAQQCSNGQPASQNRVFNSTSTGLANALDTFYMVINLHSEAAADVSTSAAALQNPPTDPTAAASLRAFLTQYSVVQLAVANDKRPLVPGISREEDLQAAGYFNASNTRLTGCGGCGLPSQCQCANAADGNNGTCLPLAVGGYWETSFAPGPGFVNIIHIVVTRVDIGLCTPMADDLDLCDASAVPETNPRIVQLRFSDGSSRSLEVTVGVGVKAFYFAPAVAFSLQVVQVDGAQASTAAGLFHLAIVGQPISETFNASAVDVNLFSSAGAAAARSAGLQPIYPCPPTTYATAGGMCAPCPYPAVSLLGSTSQANCTCPLCGDGRLQWQADEMCDDGNMKNGDGCRSAYMFAANVGCVYVITPCAVLYVLLSLWISALGRGTTRLE